MDAVMEQFQEVPGIEVGVLELEDIEVFSAAEFTVPQDTSAYFWAKFQPTWLDRIMGRIATAHAQPGKSGFVMLVVTKLISKSVLARYTAHRFAVQYMKDAAKFYKLAGVYHELMITNPEEATQRLYGAELSADLYFRNCVTQDNL